MASSHDATSTCDLLQGLVLSCVPTLKGAALGNSVDEQNSKISCLSNNFYRKFVGALKGTAKASAVDLLRLNTLRATKATFLIPKKYHKQHRLFLIFEFKAYSGL